MSPRSGDGAGRPAAAGAAGAGGRRRRRGELRRHWRQRTRCRRCDLGTRRAGPIDGGAGAPRGPAGGSRACGRGRTSSRSTSAIRRHRSGSLMASTRALPSRCWRAGSLARRPPASLPPRRTPAPLPPPADRWPAAEPHRRVAAAGDQRRSRRGDGARCMHRPHPGAAPAIVPSAPARTAAAGRRVWGRQDRAARVAAPTHRAAGAGRGVGGQHGRQRIERRGPPGRPSGTAAVAAWPAGRGRRDRGTAAHPFGHRPGAGRRTVRARRTVPGGPAARGRRDSAGPGSGSIADSTIASSCRGIVGHQLRRAPVLARADVAGTAPPRPAWAGRTGSGRWSPRTGRRRPRTRRPGDRPRPTAARGPCSAACP